MLERAKKGLANGGLTPYGYIRQDKKLIPHPKEAEEIKSIFETYIETGSLAKTYKILKEKEVKNKSGKNFSKTNIAHILRNVVYIGKIKHNNEIYQGIHESIISEEIFALAQKIHKEKRKNFRVYKNLERISVDKNYIENLVFRLNHELQTGYRAGYEPAEEWSKFSTENISDTLKFFLNGLKTTKGIERNLLAKKFLSNIFYSPENIKIRFISRQNPQDFGGSKSPAPPKAGLGEQSSSSENFEFVSLNLAPEVGFEPTTPALHLSNTFALGWTISSSKKDVSVSSLYGAPAIGEVPTVLP